MPELLLGLQFAEQGVHTDPHQHGAIQQFGLVPIGQPGCEQGRDEPHPRQHESNQGLFQGDGATLGRNQAQLP